MSHGRYFNLSQKNHHKKSMRKASRSVEARFSKEGFQRVMANET